MNYLPQRVNLISSSLIFGKLGEIPYIFLKVTTQEKNQCFLPQIIFQFSYPLCIQINLFNSNTSLTLTILTKIITAFLLKNASLEFASLTPHALRINTLRLQLHFVPQINALIPLVILAPQILHESQHQHPQPLLLMSVPLTPSPQIPTFDHIINNIFSKSLIASLTSKDTVLKEVRNCILTNNESRLQEVNPYIHSFWRDLHVLSGCLCVDEKVPFPNVLREALIDDVHASHRGTWGMICMDRAINESRTLNL